MKYLTKSYNTVFRCKATLPLYSCLALLFLIAACEKDDAPDQRMPTIEINNLAEGDTLSMRWRQEGNSFDMVVADGSGLSNYTVNIDSAGINVFNTAFSDFKFKQEHKTVQFTGLAPSFVYNARVIVQDVNNNINTFDFNLLLTGGVTPNFNYLGMVGDATPAGWNPGGSTAFTRDSNNPSVFTYRGPLKVGEIKIATFLGGWCDGQWLNSAVPNQPLTNPNYIITNGCDGPDNKWRVNDAAAGNYLITVNLAEETIVFQKQ